MSMFRDLMKHETPPPLTIEATVPRSKVNSWCYNDGNYGKDFYHWFSNPFYPEYKPTSVTYTVLGKTWTYNVISGSEGNTRPVTPDGGKNVIIFSGSGASQEQIYYDCAGIPAPNITATFTFTRVAK